VLCVSLVLLSVALLSCGKKGPPTLRSYEIPPAPGLLSAMHRENTIYLRWDFPKDREPSISHFVLLKSSGGTFGKVSSPAPAERSFNDSDFETGNTYSYKVVSQRPNGVTSKDSNVLEFTPAVPPGPPANITFRVDDNALVLSWKSSGKGIFYNVYRSFESGSYSLTPVNQAPLSDNVFRDIFYLDKKIYYTVRSLLNKETRDEGAASEEIEVNPLDFIPSPVKKVVFFATADSVFLSWEASEERWVKGYRVYRKTAGQEYTLAGETQLPAFVDREVPLTRRDYLITAVGLVREGPGTEIKGVVYIPQE